MRIDVFTLFPHWFDWFRTQRHVANAIANGHQLEAIDPRATTPLKAGKVDDVPFGGGGGVVPRVDVVEAALRPHYGADPVAPRDRAGGWACGWTSSRRRCGRATAPTRSPCASGAG